MQRSRAYASDLAGLSCAAGSGYPEALHGALMAELAPPHLLIPLSPVSPTELRALIRAAGVEDLPSALSPWGAEIRGLNQGWNEVLWAYRYNAGCQNLLEVVDRMAEGSPAIRVNKKDQTNLCFAIQECYGLEEARRAFARRQAGQLRYHMSDGELQRWLISAGMVRLLELRALDIGGSSLRAHHAMLSLPQLLRGDYRGATKQIDTFTREVIQLLMELAAHKLRHGGPVPPADGGEAKAALFDAMDELRRSLLQAGVVGAPSLFEFTEVQIEEDQQALLLPYCSLNLNGLTRPLGNLRIQATAGDPGRLRLSVTCDIAPTTLMRDIAIASALTALLRTTLRDLRPEFNNVLERTFHPNPWRAVLHELGTLQTVAPKAHDAPQLGWRIRLAVHGVEAVEPVRVTPLKKGGVRLAGIDEQEARTLVTTDPAERARLSSWSLRSRSVRVVWAPFIVSLTNAPRVFVVPPGETAATWYGPLPVVRRRLKLELQAEGAEARLALTDTALDWAALRRISPQATDDTVRIVLRPDKSALECVEVPTTLASALRALSRVEGRFPREALPELIARVPALARELDVAVHDDVVSQELPPDPRLHITLERQGLGLRVEARAITIPGGPAWPPGDGPETLYTTAESGQEGSSLIMSRRELAAEREAWERLAARIAPGAENDGGSLTVGTLAEALSAITTLREAPNTAVTWVGKPVSLHRASAKDLKLRLRSAHDWFGVGGRLQTDGGAIELKDALEALRAGSAFIPMKDGEWMELESDLRSALQAMGRALPTDRSGEVKAGPLHAPLIAELEQLGVQIDGVAAWRELVGRLQSAAELPIEVPAALTVPLRPYQEEGFRWMCRLSHWGAGAVLADDMGLGKTIQAIAWALHHAQEGPTLVISPTSVCGNWMNELERFAPTLERRLFHGDARDGALTGLRPGVVVVTSFTLATRDVETLRAVGWACLIVDEAHAIKNAATQRAKAVISLRAARRVALTGTPIENHTGELWAVLTAVAPGLLGSQESFRDRFMAAIERDKDSDARQSLARLIRPFVLRRLKRDVATELPPRTEIMVPVTLSAPERTLYNGLREAAVRETEALDAESPQSRMNVLAALTRLRRAVCHPRLIDPGLALESSKLNALYDLLEPLVESGHRALVFSQFVGLLDHVREGLDARRMRYCYLDGSTPAARRVTEIAAFQAGDAPIFLLSLKAGGTGLNLTAADTVVHLDPWWNPAVEDQATDRAHRIGQTQPVTVYRLVTRGTVEEKILGLHGEKRELATSLLEGTSSAGKLDTAELVELMRDAATGAWDEDPLDAAEAAMQAAMQVEATLAATSEPAVAPTPASAPARKASAKAKGGAQATAELPPASAGAARSADEPASKVAAASAAPPVDAAPPQAAKPQAATPQTASPAAAPPAARPTAPPKPPAEAAKSNQATQKPAAAAPSFDTVLARYSAQLTARVKAGRIGDSTAKLYLRQAERVAAIVRAQAAEPPPQAWPGLVVDDSPQLSGLSSGSVEIVRVVARALAAVAQEPTP
jgi:superfamily II DNA or RNA helicase